jgi:UPF0716 protein FxsA
MRFETMGILVLAFLAAEILSIIAVGRAIGGLGTVALLLGTSLLGLALLRHRMARAAGLLAVRLRGRRLRSSAPLRGEGLLLLGGFLLLLPGLVTDGLGLLAAALGAVTWRRPPTTESNEEVIDIPFRVHRGE